MPICPNVKVLSESDISSAVEFVDNMTPEGIASRIKTIDGRVDSSALIKALDANFKAQLTEVFV